MIEAFPERGTDMSANPAVVDPCVIVDDDSASHAAALVEDIARQRHEGQRRLARSLVRSRALRPGLRERDAADIIHALASPEVYGLLVLERHWSGERYETWLTAILSDQLLA